MQVIFVGGASGVGASCLAIQLADQWFVVDAGVRVDRKADPLPDLALLEGKDVRAIFVTHAHADHIGALPLLHQAFPTAPIFASRATALLMEIMLADALKVMTKRAVEEMELPLYPESLVSGMLTQVRPLPVGEPFTLPALPGITISASRAGHIAGAISLGFMASDGSLVVSGDISLTPQRTVIAAVPPPVERPDLLILESTYGARLHPNRQAEEQRLAQAVAECIANGGHTLVPSFGLGRGQELLLLLQAAQEKGQIPDFPIYVDGLVRRVCDTYLLLPEALSPRLQRQIRKGYLPFSGQNVTFVRDERDRERILAGPPACIVTSSGMLTGGPSAWYAARLASNANASILITGYQDEESPGRRLLDLAEQKRNTLDIGGQQVQVHCHVAKYNLSAHADGGELATYAATLNPGRVALVHGDEEARAALRELLTGMEVLLPSDGMTVEKQEKRVTRSKRATSATKAGVLDPLPTGIGEGEPFDYQHVEQLWRAVTQMPTLRIVTARELATVWYGHATEDTTQHILDILAEDYEQRYFVRQHALEEAYRVRGQHEETPGDFLGDLVGSVLLLLLSLESAKPVLCRAIEPVASVRVQLPRGISSERTRFPFSAILEVLGPAPQEVQQSPQKAAMYLADLVKAARRIRRTLSAHHLAEQCQEEAMYTLGDLCTMAGISPNSLEERLAMAKLLHQHPRLFTQQRSIFDGEGLALYSLSPEWREALEEPEEYERPDQTWILSVIEQHLGPASDLYRRSIDPDTGAVVLAFHFPEVARARHAEAIAAAEEETGVSITIAPQAHQGALAQAARKSLPQGLTAQGTPSIYHDRTVIQLTCVGQASDEEITEAQSQFHATTGWHLQLQVAGRTVSARNLSLPSPAPPQTHTTRQAGPLNQYDAIQYAQRVLDALPGYVKVSVDVVNLTLLPRFHFPDVAKVRHAALFEQIEAQTGWQVRVHPSVHHDALAEMARHLLPEGLECIGTPSLYHDRQTVRVSCRGKADAEVAQEAQRRFLEETGWQLDLEAPSLEIDAQDSPRMPQDKAIALANKKFSLAHGLYRVGADAARGTLWLHFYFPDVARQRYAEHLTALAAESGWRVELHPNVHQKALIDKACRLLPAGMSVTRPASLYQERRVLSLTCAGDASSEAIEHAQQKFAEETGWHLEIFTSDADVTAHQATATHKLQDVP